MDLTEESKAACSSAAEGGSSRNAGASPPLLPLLPPVILGGSEVVKLLFEMAAWHAQSGTAGRYRVLATRSCVRRAVRSMTLDFEIGRRRRAGLVLYGLAESETFASTFIVCRRTRPWTTEQRNARDCHRREPQMTMERPPRLETRWSVSPACDPSTVFCMHDL